MNARQARELGVPVSLTAADRQRIRTLRSAVAQDSAGKPLVTPEERARFQAEEAAEARRERSTR